MIKNHQHQHHNGYRIMPVLKQYRCLLTMLIAIPVMACITMLPGIAMGQTDALVPARSGTTEEIIDPHFTGKDCDVCHTGSPKAGDSNLGLKFGGDDIAMCNSCHQTEYLSGDLHPVAVSPPEGDSVRIPDDFPLYAGQITCRTCHDVYLQCRLLPALQYENTNFLRGAPYKKTIEICFRCHNREAYKKTNPHEQRDEADNIIPERCLYCHQSLPDPEKAEAIKDVTFKTATSTFCFACHGEEEKLHPARANHAVTVPEDMLESIKSAEQEHEVSLPLFDGAIFCGTCHNPHDRGIIKREAAAKVADEKLRVRLGASYELCVACHREKEDLAERDTVIHIQDKDLAAIGDGGDIPSYHKSFLEKKCRACHSITREQPEPPAVYKMCFTADCHTVSLLAGRYKHDDVEQANCLLCHSQHGSQYGAHIRNDQQKLCRACHPLLKHSEETGDAAAAGPQQGEDFHDYYLQLFRKLLPDQELSCRYCHGEDHSALVYKTGITSCYQCHTYIQELIAGKPGKPKNVHATLSGFPKNRCTDCHNPHSSAYPFLLEEEPDSYQ